MLKKLTHATVKHTLLAIGLAATAALAVIPESGPIGWRHVAIVAGTTLLAGLGVGYAARQAPPK
jgi:hypothetical protein